MWSFQLDLTFTRDFPCPLYLSCFYYIQIQIHTEMTIWIWRIFHAMWKLLTQLCKHQRTHLESSQCFAKHEKQQMISFKFSCILNLSLLDFLTHWGLSFFSVYVYCSISDHKRWPCRLRIWEQHPHSSMTSAIDEVCVIYYCELCHCYIILNFPWH